MQNKYSNRVIIFGEILFDIFENKELLGGAPFNVAKHLKEFGLEPIIISRIGNDERGKTILRKMKLWNMETSGIQIDEKHQTGIVNIKIKNGEPQFSTLNEFAYDYIQFDESFLREYINKNSILYHGLLALRNKQSLKSFLKIRKILNPKIFFDINLRGHWRNQELINNCLNKTNWLKLNEYELSDIKKDENIKLIDKAKIIAKKYNLNQTIITRGNAGAVIINKENKLFSAIAKKPEIVDTVGAGDAFSAVVILGIIKNWSESKTIERAVEFSTKMCEVQGAIFKNSNIYNNFLWEWEKNI
ncbi:MAG: PfkB family carbohydrate kinase [Candidatus Marinimicrobia bacterium]|nr:PfkB family carbohydrate kinase [Candidatus Neomarinimicrobiota bacterium]